VTLLRTCRCAVWHHEQFSSSLFLKLQQMLCKN
jgi:hypothetical protein